MPLMFSEENEENGAFGKVGLVSREWDDVLGQGPQKQDRSCCRTVILRKPSITT